PSRLYAPSPSSFHRHGRTTSLHSFPTRRSSDLAHLPAEGRDDAQLVLRDHRPRQRADRRLDLDAVLEELARERDLVHERVLQGRSEEHTSELQSLTNLVCRLLLEKKKNATQPDS